MKAYKQVKLMMFEEGQRFFERRNDLDSISITDEKLEELRLEIDKLVDRGIELNFIPFIKEGYFEIHDNNRHVYYKFICEELEGNLVLRIHAYGCTPNEIEVIGKSFSGIFWLAGYGFLIPTEPCIPNEEIGVNRITAYDIYYKEKGINNYEIPEDFNKLLEGTEAMSIVLYYLFAYINYLSEYPEYKIIDGEKERAVNKDSSKQKIKTGTDKPKVQSNEPTTINLNGLKMVLKNQKIVKRIKSKTPRKYIGTWNVRGHYRHYKNGKTVYINSYTKGNSDDKSEGISKRMRKYIFE